MCKKKKLKFFTIYLFLFEVNEYLQPNLCAKKKN
jgi:hypothetical protein